MSNYFRYFTSVSRLRGNSVPIEKLRIENRYSKLHGSQLFLRAENGKYVSPFHDISRADYDPASGVFPFVCEIPRGATKKMEVKLNLEYNPIVQDEDKLGPRFLSIKPAFNYGMLPRTYGEDLNRTCPISGYPGDEDPLDVVDISKRVLQVGSVVPSQLLGSFCFIDGRKADWKIIVSDNQHDDLSEEVLEPIWDFFENYKGPNSGNFIYGNRKLFSRKETLQVLQHGLACYEKLCSNPAAFKRTDVWFGPTDS